MSVSTERKPTVCVDLDGTLARYDGWKGVEHIGDPLPGAVEFVRELTTFAEVVIYTTRCKAFPDGKYDSGDSIKDYVAETPEDLARRVSCWLQKHDFPLQIRVYAGQGKPIASAYIDDRSVVCQPQRHGENAYRSALVHTRKLCGGEFTNSPPAGGPLPEVRDYAILPGGVYTHFKGNRYTLLHVAQSADNADDRDDVLVYVSHLNGNIYTRKRSEFFEPVAWPDGVTRPRFVGSLTASAEES